MDLKKRHWLCFGYGIFTLLVGYIAIFEIHLLLFGYILRLKGPFLKCISPPYIYISAQSQHQLVLLIIAFIVMAFGVLFCIPWSLNLFNKARLYLKPAKELDLSDVPLKFPYILYLHSFDTQSKTSLSLKNASQTEEEIIIHSLSPIGKTVAIGCPANSIPLLGGFRICVSDDEWQNTVMQLSKDAELTAIRIGDTEHLGWDIKYALMNIPDLQKLIFLIPDIEKTDLAFFAKLEKAILECRPNEVEISDCFFNKQGWGTVSSIIYFEKNEIIDFEKNEKDSAPQKPYTMKQSRVPRRRIWNRFGNLLTAFQKTMFPVYKQFGKLSFMKKVGNFLSTYYLYILALIIFFYLPYLNIDLKQQFPSLEQPITSEGYTQAIQEAEQKYPKLANILAKQAHERQRGFMMDNVHLGCKYLTDEHLIELAALELQVYKIYKNRENVNYGVDYCFSQLPEMNAIKLNNYMMKSVLMAHNLEEPEYTSISTPEEFQNELMEARSSLTEEQYETIIVLLSSCVNSEEAFFKYIEYIAQLPNDSVKAQLFRGGYIMGFRYIKQ